MRNPFEVRASLRRMIALNSQIDPVQVPRVYSRLLAGRKHDDVSSAVFWLLRAEEYEQIAPMRLSEMKQSELAALYAWQEGSEFEAELNQTIRIVSCIQPVDQTADGMTKFAVYYGGKVKENEQ